MKILVATDGSQFSEAAVETLCRIIKNAENADVAIVSAYEPPMMAVAAPYAVSAGYNPVLEKEMRGLAAACVADAAQKISAQFPDLKGNLLTRVLCGPPAQAIVREAEEWGADLIVVGSHGYGFWERMILGSVSNAILHHAHCSVLVVRKSKNLNGNTN